MNNPEIIITGTILMLAMISTIIIFIIIHQRSVIRFNFELNQVKQRQQQQLVQAAIESEETERKRISLELHDEVGALLSTAKLYLNQIQPMHFNDTSKIQLLTNCKQLLDTTVKTVRTISSNLQPAVISDFGLESALHLFCDQLNNSKSINCSTKVQGNIMRFQPEKELAIFRIVQELTNNILKHANATSINYGLIEKGNTLQIFIEHNGYGLTQQEFEQKLYNSHGLGLKNIQNRLNILKASIHFEKTSAEQSSISCLVPLNS